jgi:hypothetical protein
MEGQETGQWNFFIVFKRDLKVVVRSAKNYPAVMPGRYVTVGEEVDRCVEHKSSVLVAIRRDIRTATGQAQAQRRSRADLVKLDFYEAPVIQSAALLSAPHRNQLEINDLAIQDPTFQREIRVSTGYGPKPNALQRTFGLLTEFCALSGFIKTAQHGVKRNVSKF